MIVLVGPIEANAIRIVLRGEMHTHFTTGLASFSNCGYIEESNVFGEDPAKKRGTIPRQYVSWTNTLHYGVSHLEHAQ